MAMSAADRIGVTISNLESSNQSLIAEVRNSLVSIKMIAEDLERENLSDMGWIPAHSEFLKKPCVVLSQNFGLAQLWVKKLDEATLELIPISDDIVRLSSALHWIGGNYESSNEPTDFKKLLDDRISQLEADSPSMPQNHAFYKQFKEAVWKVHHVDEPLPGEEQEEIIMTSSQCNLVNSTCPLSGKPVIELEDPVRSTDCKHIYDRQAVMRYIKLNGKRRGCKCAAAGCPKMLTAEILICDPLLRIEIEESRVRGSRSTQAQIVADCTEIDED